MSDDAPRGFYAFFVRRPLLVNLLMIFSLVAGLAATSFMNFQSFPKVDLGIVNVTTVSPGDSSEDVELSITVPLEEEILKVDGVDKLLSSSMEGLSVLTVRLELVSKRVMSASSAIGSRTASGTASATCHPECRVGS